MIFKNNIILALSVLTFAGCANDDEMSQEQSRLPLTFETSLSGSLPVTRAVDGSFDAGDELLCYVRHIYSTDLSTDKNYLEVESYKKLVTIVNGEPTEKLYWDDFSDNNSDDHYLRTANHALQSFYGYCYNGGKPTTDLDKATGVLGWTTDDDQTPDGDMKKNDLLWSPAQNPVTYVHEKKNDQGKLEVPYSHAMSKFTIVVVAGDGFKAEDLDYATVTLNGMNAKGTFTAPTSKVDVPTDGTTTVKMYANTASTTADNKPCRAYEAVVVPLTALTKDNLLATIESMSGNTYMVNITDDMLTKWSEKEALNTGKTKSGYNYKLTVTLNKQTVGVVASLANWSDVSAEGTGEIQFSADIKTTDATSSTFAKNDAFSLWMATDKDNMGSIATTSKFDGSKFVNSPAIYWPNGSACYYFRALAKTSSVANKTMDAATLDDVTQGTDLLWGTTVAHKGNATIDYAEGAAINPRTGEVPLVFKHAMSNVVIKLKTADKDTDPDYIDLTGAKVKLVKLASSGSIDIAYGKVSASSTLDDLAFEKTVDTEYKVTEFMVPQTLTSDAQLVITVADGTINGTKYSLKLSDCTLENSTTAISEWESGKQYTYTITLKKEAVLFRVMVQEWIPTKGSGNATLDWD